GFAVTKKDLTTASFYDFDSQLEWNLQRKGEVTWAFAVWPQNAPSDIRCSRGYRFTLSVAGHGPSASVIKLRGFRCEHLGDLSCTPLLFVGSGDDRRIKASAKIT